MKTLLTFFLSAISLLSIGQIPNAFPVTGLVAYYPFTGNANDVSGNGNNGVVHGATPIPDRFGNANSAYAFNIGDGDTSDYISIANSTKLSPTNSISIAAWVWISDSATSNFQRIVSKQYTQAQSYASYQLIAGSTDSIGAPGLTLRTSSSYNWTGLSEFSATNRWTFICGTWDGSNMKFYQSDFLNQGVYLLSTTPQTGNILYDNEELWISKGLDGNGKNEYFKGYVDDVAIWNRAISDSEINVVYNYTGGNVGINTTSPARNLDINNTLRLEPRNSAPSNPSKGDIYFDGTINKLRVFDGTFWQNCW